jgi:dTDP-glucose pyrophosphorylase
MKWKDESLNVLIPMAGLGSRFKDYTFPKPLIEINKKPMIQVVTENLNVEASYIYIVREEHYEKYNLYYMLNLISPHCKLVIQKGNKQGAACTSLLAKKLIDNDRPLLIANSDQWIDWSSSDFFYKINNADCDGAILTFKNNHPKWSYVKVDEYDYITEVKEKIVISDIATVGIYYWKKGSDYVKSAEQMINKWITHNNEYYIAPTFNEAIENGLKFKRYDVNEMLGLGTPEDLEYFLKHKEL